MFNNVAIIAANLDVTEEVIDYIKSNNLNIPIIVLEKSITQITNYGNVEYFNIERTAEIIKYLKDHGKNKVVFTGKFTRPDLKSLRPDLKGAKLLYNILRAKISGDDNLLKIIINFLAEEKIEVISLQELIPNFLDKSDFNNLRKPGNNFIDSINLSIKTLKQLGELDIGQSLIVNNKRILAIEAAEGTDEMIKRCAKMKFHNGNSIFVKLTKTGQDLRVDLPAIGLNTIDLLLEHNFAGLVIDKNVLIINKELVLQKLQKSKLFCWVVE